MCTVVAATAEDLPEVHDIDDEASQLLEGRECHTRLPTTSPLPSIQGTMAMFQPSGSSTPPGSTLPLGSHLVPAPDLCCQLAVVDPEGTGGDAGRRSDSAYRKQAKRGMIESLVGLRASGGAQGGGQAWINQWDHSELTPS